jgi:hypothetical protein
MFTVAVDRSATQGYGKRRCYVLVYSSLGVVSLYIRSRRLS